MNHQHKHTPNTNQTQRQNHTHMNKLKQNEMKKYFQHFKRTNSAHAIGISNTNDILKNCTFNNYKKGSH